MTEFINDEFIAEVCQSMLAVREVMRATGINRIAQEITCNSVGGPYFMKLLGRTYEDYVAIARRVTIGPTGGPQYPLYILDRKVWDVIKVQGLPLSVINR